MSNVNARESARSISSVLIPAEPIHPGEFLKDDLEALGLTVERFAMTAGLPIFVVRFIVEGKRDLDRELCVKLAAALKQEPMTWLAYQYLYDAAILKHGKETDR